MTQTLPPLVVSIDKAAVVRTRMTIRRGKVFSAWFTLLMGVIGTTGAGVLLVTVAQSTPRNPFFVFFFIVPLAVAVGLVAYGAHQFRRIARDGSYWRADDIAEQAFVVTSGGLEVALDPSVPTQVIAWPSVLALRMLPRKLEFTLAPGVLPPRFRNTLQFGYRVIDQDRVVIADAVRQLSDNTVIAS